MTAAPATNARAPAPPTTLVIFGASGDLTRRLLAPSLANMMAAGLVDQGLTVIGVARNPMDDEAFRKSLEDFEPGKPHSEDMAKAWARLRGQIHYLSADFTRADAYGAIADRIAEAGNASVVFYLATAPAFFATIAQELGKAGLLDQSKGERRLAVEKPFGHDLASARELNRLLLDEVDEAHLFRIDHFLGKETVQNIMVARFANAMIEAVWNRAHVDHVQITVAETVDVGARGSFFDATGALRDMVPNHLFQILAMVAMEPPLRFDADAIRGEKARLLRAVRVPDAEEARADAVRGAYTAGHVAGKPVGAYRQAIDVSPDSRTETYAALRLMIDNWRWEGVPFYLRTGKAMTAKDSEVVVQFKPVPYARFRDVSAEQFPANRLALQLQPNEGLKLDFLVKKPGPAIETAPVAMKFCYADLFDLGGTTGYETLLYDVMTGDQTLFQRADAVETSWGIVQPVLDAWAADGEPELYPAGSDGPESACQLLARDGREWHGIGT
jgi:glucose-6-phosphate 1-dehydrogenase